MYSDLAWDNLITLQVWVDKENSIEFPLSWLGKMAKVIIYFSFSFLFLSGLTTQGWSMRKYHITKCHRVTGLWVTVRWLHMTKSHGNHGKIVHRPCSSCISSIGNLTETPLSSSCQLGLGVWLSCLRLSHYTGESNEELYWVLPEQPPWLSSKSSQLHANTRTELSFIPGEQRELDRVSLRFGLLLIPLYMVCATNPNLLMI